MIIDTSDISKAKNLLKKEGEIKIVKAKDEKFNRKMLEYGKFNILLSPEIDTGKTSLRKVDSGLNHVLCRLASKNNISIGIDLQQVKSLEKKQKAVVLEKIMQNIKLCRKYKVNLAICNVRDKLNANAFLLSLGASTEQVAKALTFYVKFRKL
ncbi:MAG: hypothetical protein AABW80_01025 [Nanoarchaeota archaeon]